jgi:aspartyl-tRNA(Asn)/glutamyl-tRNA(Gln) amidotransferase subunit C
MQLDDALISKLEKLANLELDPADRDTIRQDLNKMLDMVATLQSVDTSQVEPLVYLHQYFGPMREDLTEPTLGTTQALANAPLTDGSHFLVPKVIKNN